ncbi:helix-turn-helix transcriptional regulator [Candidatus Bathyarchaeota archaeon]|nr:helix-turn-helix transcriptional regulator [Candidatus Bathyarchaeota archaeon]
MKDEGEDVSQIYSAVSHPFRKRIIEIIGEKGRSTFTELKKELHTTVGTLYYHIDMLKGLITQDERKRYILTERGKLAYTLLVSDEERFKAVSLIEKKASARDPFSRFCASLKGFVLPIRLFELVYTNPVRMIPEALLIIGFGAWLAAASGLEPIMLFYHNPFRVSPLIIVLQYVLSWLTIFALCEFLTFLFFRRGRGGELALLVGCAFSLLPLDIFPVVWFLSAKTGLFFYFLSAVMFLLQAWSLGLLTSTVCLSKGLRPDKGALVSVLIAYINLIIVLFLRF